MMETARTNHSSSVARNPQRVLIMTMKSPRQQFYPAPSGARGRPYDTSLIVGHVVMTAAFYICSKTCLVDFSNAESALAFYGVYHREPLNQLIHFIGVPLILWTLLVVAAHMVLPVSLLVSEGRPPLIPSLPFIPAHYATWATVWALLYVAFYFSVDTVGAALYLPFIYMYYATAVRWTAGDQQRALTQSSAVGKDKTPVISWLGTGRLTSWACVIHALSWYAQIHPGHLMIEGASPAVLANIGGALMAAPLFAFYEGVWFCGLQTSMQERVARLVEQYTLDLCQQGVDMRVCAQVLG